MQLKRTQEEEYNIYLEEWTAEHEPKPFISKKKGGGRLRANFHSNVYLEENVTVVTYLSNIK